MTTNDATRAALVRILTDVSVRYERSRFPQQFEEAIDTAIDEIDRLLADRAVPEPDAVHAVHEALVNSAPEWMIDREDGELFDMARAVLAAVPTVQVAAGDAPGLDELLDWYQCRLYTSSPNKWQAMISRSQDEWGADDQPVGFGPTRIAAVQSAVANAKGGGK